MAKISVIIPVYNAEDTLHACMDCLLSQTLPDIEIILVNDGSTDKSGELCELYAKSNSSVRTLNKENGGAASARNEGLKLATGEYIGFVDCDDRIESDMYEYLLGKAEAYSADIVQCATYLDTDSTSEVIHSPDKDIIRDGVANFDRDFFRTLSSSNWSKLYKREVIEGISFSPSYVIGEDLYFNLFALCKARRVALCREPKYHYIQREGSICSSPPTRERLLSHRLMLKAAKENFSEYPTLLKFIREAELLNNNDITSKIVLGGISDCEDILKEIRREARKSFSFIMWKSALPLKERYKLFIIGFFFESYKRQLRTLKPQESGGDF